MAKYTEPTDLESALNVISDLMDEIDELRDSLRDAEYEADSLERDVQHLERQVEDMANEKVDADAVMAKIQDILEPILRDHPQYDTLDLTLKLRALEQYLES